jgi:hypothetical protein
MKTCRFSWELPSKLHKQSMAMACTGQQVLKAAQQHPTLQPACNLVLILLLLHLPAAQQDWHRQQQQHLRTFCS